LIPGKRTSMMTRSGRWSRNSWIAASPVPASPTTSMSGSTLSEAERPMRTIKWSSTTRIRLGFRFFIGLRDSVQRHLNENFGPRAGLAVDFELGTHRLRPLAHIEQSKMPGGERRNKAAAVVCYGQVYVPGSVTELNRDLG